MELSGFSKPIHSLRRFKNRRAKRASGGVIIYIKDEIRKGIKLIKNDIDSIIWIKLDKQFFCTQNDRFIAAAYIPPENSPIHDIYNVDLFQQLEADINQYSQFAEIYVIGDLNSRVGRKNDFIENDIILTEFEDNSVCTDVPIRRLSMDSGSNKYGDCLLDLCKATGLRIVNGRLFDNTHRMTCFTANGESLIDYILTREQNFSSFENVTVHEYNEFSNHAPISFSLKIGTQRSREATTKYREVYKWNEDCKVEFVNSLKNDIDLLQNIVQENESVDCIVNKFSTFITDRANPFFKKVVRVNQENIFTGLDCKGRQKWYDENCKLKNRLCKRL